MDTRSRTHLAGWRSITRQKYAKLLLKGHICTELENYCGSNTGSDLYIMLNGLITDGDTYAS